MAITFKFVTGNEAPGPLGVLAIAEYPNLMVGTDCDTPAVVKVLSNWHFRVENVPEADMFPRYLYGPAPAYGTWYNPSATSQRTDYKCNEDLNWPMHVVQSSGANGYTWDIYVAPYLGGSYIAGIEPMLPLQGTGFTLELARGSEHYMLVPAEVIPFLFPIFGEARDGKSNADFYPALFGFNYEYNGTSGHVGVDIVPRGLFDGGQPSTDWDLDPNNAELKTVFAVVGGTVHVDQIEPGVRDITIYTTFQDPPYRDPQFIYAHIEPKPGLGSSVSAGDEIGTILNHQLDSRSDQTHLHFELKKRGSSEPGRICDPRQYIYPGLTET